MSQYTWILTPNLYDIDLEKVYEYSSHDEKCLVSSFYLDEITNFLNTHNIKFSYREFNINYQWKFIFIIDDVNPGNIIQDIMNFKIGRYRTSSIYINMYRINGYNHINKM